jgi:hypothetical protein
LEFYISKNFGHIYKIPQYPYFTLLAKKTIS